jgi:hypothetical protein
MVKVRVAGIVMELILAVAVTEAEAAPAPAGGRTTRRKAPLRPEVEVDLAILVILAELAADVSELRPRVA